MASAAVQLWAVTANRSKCNETALVTCDAIERLIPACCLVVRGDKAQCSLGNDLKPQKILDTESFGTVGGDAEEEDEEYRRDEGRAEQDQGGTDRTE